MTSSDAELSAWLGYDVELRRASEEERGTYEIAADFEHEDTSEWISWNGPRGSFHDNNRTQVSIASESSFEGWDERRFRFNVIVDGDGEDDAHRPQAAPRRRRRRRGEVDRPLRHHHPPAAGRHRARPRRAAHDQRPQRAGSSASARSCSPAGRCRSATSCSDAASSTARAPAAAAPGRRSSANGSPAVGDPLDHGARWSTGRGAGRDRRARPTRSAPTPARPAPARALYGATSVRLMAFCV